MSKRSAGQPLDQSVKRQRSQTLLKIQTHTDGMLHSDQEAPVPDTIIDGLAGVESPQVILEGQRDQGATKCTLQLDQSCSAFVETRHETTPNDPCFLRTVESLPLTDSLEASLQELMLRDGNSSDSQHTLYEPGPDKCEERHGRIFAAPLYGQECHRYYFPVDKWEEDRQDIANAAWLSTTEPLCLSVSAGTVLDLGTGKGLWVNSVAKMRPDCRVIGIDLYYSEPPEVCDQAEFEVDDCELDFDSERTGAVSLVNLRDSFLWVRNLDGLIAQVHGILTPNGGFQSQELRLSAWKTSNSPIAHWRDQVLKCAGQLGIQLHSAAVMEQTLARHGFVDFNRQRLRWSEESVPQLQDFVRLTISASVRILSEGLGPVEAMRIIDRALMASVVEGGRVEVWIDICWARKGAGDRPGTQSSVAS